MKIIKPHSGKAFASAVVTAALVITPTAVAFANDEPTPEVVTSEEAAPQVELESTDPAPTQEQAEQEDVVQTPTEEVESPAPVSEDTAQVPEQTKQEAPAVQPESVSVPLSEPVEPPAPADVTKPKALLKPGLTEVASAGPAKSVSYALRDDKAVTGTWLNGVWKAVSPNKYSDHNDIKPGRGGAVEGVNTLVVQDASGNLSTEYKFVLDTSGPKAEVKPDSSFTVGTDGLYQLVSFALEDQYSKVAKIDLNGVTKDLTPNKWSDLNYVKPGVFGGQEGLNTLTTYDTLGNTAVYTFVLDTIKPALTLPQGVILGSKPVTFHVTQDEANPARTYVEIQQLVNGKWKKFSGKEYQGANAFDFTVDAKALGLLEGVDTQIKVSTTDKAGNHTSATSKVTVDYTKVKVTITSPASGAIVKGGAAIEATATDNAGLKSATANVYDASNATLIKSLGSKSLSGTEGSTSWNLPANLPDGT